MYKSKNGKVFASLTEVKNKTGDIFALVDEFQEVSITSYNKVRYKIVKVDINSVIDLSETEKEKVQREVKKVTKAPALEVKDEPEVEEIPKHEEPIEIPEVKLEEKQPEPVVETKEEAQEESFQTESVVPWNRDSSNERDFVAKAIKNLN